MLAHRQSSDVPEADSESISSIALLLSGDRVRVDGELGEPPLIRRYPLLTGIVRRTLKGVKHNMNSALAGIRQGRPKDGEQPSIVDLTGRHQASLLKRALHR
jgi:hypothetical protein